MIILRFLLIAFNVGIVTFLIYRMLRIFREPMDKTKRAIILTGGIILLIAPFGIFFNIFTPSFQYFLIYPVAISLFLYLNKQF